VRKYHHNLSALVLRSVAQREKERVVKSRLIPRNRCANRSQNVSAVRSESRNTGQIATIGIESNFVCRVEGSNKVCDRILREHETAIHVVARIKQDKDVGASNRIKRNRGADCLARGGHVTALRTFPCSVALSKIEQRARWTVAFREGCELLWNSVLRDGE